MNVSHVKNAALALLVGFTMIGCGEDAPTEPAAQEEIPCGIRVCTTEDIENYGPDNISPELSDAKADAQSVELAIRELSADGVLDADDVARAFEETGNRVNDEEMAAIRDGVMSTDYEVTEEALQTALDMALVANIEGREAEELLSGRSFGGTDIPDEVRNMVAHARLAGAVAYDVDELNSDGERIWSPYPATTPPTDNMAFDYTEITPEKLFGDLNDADVEYNRIVGTETATTSWGQEYKRVKYEPGKGGTGNILAQYDEVYHPDIYARGTAGQIWANNFAILSDGTMHCLPASRRSIRQDLILTNPHLSRGKHMLYNGHLDVREGVVVGVEMSGRLSKRAGKGKAKFVDPVALLKAWGFEVSPSVRVRFGNTSDGVPVINAETNVIESAN